MAVVVVVVVAAVVVVVVVVVVVMVVLRGSCSVASCRALAGGGDSCVQGRGLLQ